MRASSITSLASASVSVAQVAIHAQLSLGWNSDLSSKQQGCEAILDSMSKAAAISACGGQSGQLMAVSVRVVDACASLQLAIFVQDLYREVARHVSGPFRLCTTSVEPAMIAETGFSYLFQTLARAAWVQEGEWKPSDCMGSQFGCDHEVVVLVLASEPQPTEFMASSDTLGGQRHWYGVEGAHSAVKFCQPDKFSYALRSAQSFAAANADTSTPSARSASDTEYVLDASNLERPMLSAWCDLNSNLITEHALKSLNTPAGLAQAQRTLDMLRATGAASVAFKGESATARGLRIYWTSLRTARMAEEAAELN